MKEHYVTYEQADKLKELGFDWPCTAHFSSDGSQLWTKHQEVINSEEFESPAAPRLDQAQAWLREVKGMDIEPRIWFAGDKREYRPYVMPPKCKDYIALPPEESYELALSAGIDAALELLTDK